MRFRINGQINASEYVIVFAIISAVIMGMTVFFRRLMQARIYDTRNYAATLIHEQTGELNLAGNVANALLGYDPYYLNTLTFTNSTQQSYSEVTPGEREGTFYRNFLDEVSSDRQTIYLPPKRASGENAPQE